MSSVHDALLSDSEDEGNISENVDKKDEEPSSSEEEISKEDEEDEAEGIELETLISKPEEITQLNAANKSFKDIGINTWLIQRLSTIHITKPTPVQAACIPKVLEGCDVLGCAKTGTGKTLAFALPILNELAVDPFGIFALVLTPTRELALQIADQFNAIGRPISLKCTCIIGGQDITTQAAELASRPHIVVATPGRLADHLELNPESFSKCLQKIKYFVLDEADRMLDGQYDEQLKAVFKAIPRQRHTLLFSATITSAISQLHQVSLKKPYYFEDKSEVVTADRLEQKYVLCPVAVKDAYLVYVVKNYRERNSSSSVMIFAQTCRECQALAYMFKGLGIEVASLHSQIPQKLRTAALASFRSKTLRILISTDVASRGLDIPHVDLVVNHNVPQCPKTYVHRVGRSARAGRFGSAVTFVTQYDVVLLQAVEDLVGQKLEELKVNDKKVSQYVTKVLVAKKEAELQLEQQNFGEKHETNKRKEMLMNGMDEEEVDRLIEEKKLRRISGRRRKIDSLSEKVHKLHKKLKEME